MKHFALAFRCAPKTFFHGCILLLAGCASTGIPTDNTSLNQKGLLGLMWTVNNNQIIVTEVTPNTPAHKAGLRSGDIIIGHDSTIIGNAKSDRERFAQKLKNSPNTSIQLRLQRDNQELTLTAHIQSVPVGPLESVLWPIDFMLSEGEPVRLAIIVTDISNAILGSDPESPQGRAWISANRQLLTTSTEQAFLQAYSDRKNFTIIDRINLDKYFDELKLQMSGAIDSSTAKRLGMLSGATHILTVSSHRTLGAKKQMQENYFYRLLAIESGTVLGAASLTHEFNP